ncbi:hypothetical protein [Gaetbulibacter aestuarii]|uniref:Uncharacterized protein n=1 Tax=Gaetbulibacter aestuarii TaxID=1502358 RepID=A0ABW7MZJ5_9FLAO
MPQSFIFSILALMTEDTIVVVLSVVVVFFAVLLLLGIRKSYLLKKENERLDEINKQIMEQAEDIETYRDFTEGHLYSNDKK